VAGCTAMTDFVVGYETEHDRDEGMAREALVTLCKHYPGHAWFVTIKGGVFFVKNLHMNEKWGMCLHYSGIKGDANARARDLVRSAGEFLERANRARGRADGSKVRTIEGVPEKHMARAGL
jgi:hypothetical protein